MRLLVFGKTGQVARELGARCPPGVAAQFLGRDEADLLNPEVCALAVDKADVDIVINAAAWTAVDKAEAEEEAATIVNAAAPGAMARACAEKNLPFLHISTDYVFDGGGQEPFAPDHVTAPLGAYGRSKLLGEHAVRAVGGLHVVLRTSWVVSAHGNNFVKTMLRLGHERESLRVVADQIGGPTPASAIADALFVIARGMADRQRGGTYHFAGAPDASWADVARAVMEEVRLDCRIDDIPTSDYPTPATRPLNSRLDCLTLRNDFGIDRPNWRDGLTDILKDLDQ